MEQLKETLQKRGLLRLQRRVGNHPAPKTSILCRKSKLQKILLLPLFALWAKTNMKSACCHLLYKVCNIITFYLICLLQPVKTSLPSSFLLSNYLFVLSQITGRNFKALSTLSWEEEEEKRRRLRSHQFFKQSNRKSCGNTETHTQPQCLT